jgi:hypothetical protein
MEMELAISLMVRIDDSGANLNEICAAIQESIRSELAVCVAEEVIEGFQENIRDRLCTQSCQEAGVEALGAHRQKEDPERECKGRRFIKQGYRSSPRKVKTDIGELSFRVGYVQCVDCGKKWAPIMELLEIRPKSHHSTGLERLASEAVMKTSYKRGEEDIEGRGAAPVPRSTAHRWVVQRELPASEIKQIETGMADGTGFKKWPGERGNLRIVIGFEKDKKVRPVGVWAGKSWEDIGKDIRERMGQEDQDETRWKFFTQDGEVGLDDHLASLAERSQRCIWHLPRELGYAMWKDEAPLPERKVMSAQLAGLVGIDIPEEDWETIKPKDRKELRRKVAGSEKEIQQMIDQFRAKGYSKAANYLENACGKVFAHVHLWLETGIVAPRTTSILENIIKELGRRVKKLGWNWTDDGVEQMSKMVLLRRFDRELWEEYWKQELGLHGRCRIEIKEIRRVA